MVSQSVLRRILGSGKVLQLGMFALALSQGVFDIKRIGISFLLTPNSRWTCARESS
jgi:hypothetical protein